METPQGLINLETRGDMNNGGFRLTVLVDNEAVAPLVREHGLSILIETGDQSILFDTGHGPALLENARTLGIDLGQVSSVVLSHGHYDHSGGLCKVISSAQRAKLYAHPGSVIPRYSLHDGVARNLQMPLATKLVINSLCQEQIHWVTAPLDLGGGANLTGTIPRQNDFETTGGPFFLDMGGTRDDLIADDQALWLDTPFGLLVVVGCCHSGLMNTLQRIMHLSGQSCFLGIVGGFHLLNANEDRLLQTCSVLQDLDIRFLVPCHCTGDNAIRQLKDKLGAKVIPGQAGLSIVLSGAGILNFNWPELHGGLLLKCNLQQANGM